MIRELPAGETHLAYKAMFELRPAMGDEAAFVERVDKTMRPEGYRLVASFADGDEQAALPSTGISWAELAERYRRRG